MISPFLNTPVTYFTAPDALIESSIIGDISPSALRLYLLLLYLSQQRGNKVIELTAAEAAEKTKLARNSFGKAVRECQNLNLVTTKRNRYGLTFELLDPLSGSKLVPLADIKKVDPGVVRVYFLQKLADYAPEEFADGTGLRAQCPFHSTIKLREKPLSVFYSGGDGGGGFNCHVCGIRGNILEFQQALDNKHGFKTDTRKAYAKIRAIHLDNMRKLGMQNRLNV